MGFLFYHHYHPCLKFHTDVLVDINSNVLGGIFPCCSHFVSRVLLPVFKHGVAYVFVYPWLQFILDISYMLFADWIYASDSSWYSSPSGASAPSRSSPTYTYDSRLSSIVLTFFLLYQRYLNLLFQWYSLLWFSTLITLYIVGGFSPYLSDHNCQKRFPYLYQLINALPIP